MYCSICEVDFESKRSHAATNKRRSNLRDFMNNETDELLFLLECMRGDKKKPSINNFNYFLFT